MLLAAIQVLQCWCIPDIGSVTAGFSVEVWEASVVYQITGRDRKINMSHGVCWQSDEFNQVHIFYHLC